MSIPPEIIEESIWSDISSRISLQPLPFFNAPLRDGEDKWRFVDGRRSWGRHLALFSLLPILMGVITLTAFAALWILDDPYAGYSRGVTIGCLALGIGVLLAWVGVGTSRGGKALVLDLPNNSVVLFSKGLGNRVRERARITLEEARIVVHPFEGNMRNFGYFKGFTAVFHLDCGRMHDRFPLAVAANEGGIDLYLRSLPVSIQRLRGGSGVPLRLGYWGRNLNTKIGRLSNGCCPTCGYSLKGSPEMKCPECGNVLDFFAVLRAG